MVEISILIALENEVTSNKLKILLSECDQRNIVQAFSSAEMLRTIQSNSPDLIIMGFKFQEKSLVELVDFINESCDILAIVTKSQRDLIGEDLGIFLIDIPLSPLLFKNSITMIIQGRLRKYKLLNKIKELEMTLNDRKIIEKAKGIIMVKLKLNEEEAFKLIRNKSMDLCCKMVDLSKEIISKGGL
ncbi:MAG: ANTAR domain-containing response regulator [Clostridium sp.]